MTTTSVLASPAGVSPVLLLAPTGRDAEVTALLLERAGIPVEICRDIDDLCERLNDNAGAVLMTAEAMNSRALMRVAQLLEAQPAWSELPFLILLPQAEAARSSDSFAALGKRAHVTLVDKPIHVKTLVSATEAALRSRARQYAARDLLAELRARVAERDELLARERLHAARLAGLAQASLAIASAASLDEALQMITDEACRIIGSQLAATVIRIEENGRKRTIRAMSCRSSKSNWIDDETGNATEILEKLVTHLPASARIADLASHPISHLIDTDGLRSALLAPLQERGGVTIGVIALASSQKNAMGDDDEAVVTQLAHMASAAIQNARLYREAQAANQAKDDFLATLAHELRTPMTGILGWIQMLKYDKTQQRDVDTAIAMIESSTRIQVRLVEDLLDVSRIIAGKLRIDVGPVELAPVVETVIETFRARARESNVELFASIEREPLSVLGDETRLHQIVWNLLSNAIKFTPEGGSVRLELARTNGNAVIRVIDSGQGISPEFLPHVFDRFQQADNSTTRRESGLGLGLAIVRYLVELHSGTVEAHSEGMGHGATFSVTLPLMAVVADDAPGPPERQAPRLNGIHVMIVDDEPATGDLVAEVLTKFGAETLAVTSVNDAVKALRRFAADVIVSDIAMPGEDGYALMRRLRDIEPALGRAVPAMALTAYGRPDDRKRILTSGFQWYMQKPVAAIELAHAIEKLVSAEGADA
jgi:signal transduction histidine kinase/DNA-binding response OmpR family regulator